MAVLSFSMMIIIFVIGGRSVGKSCVLSEMRMKKTIQLH